MIVKISFCTKDNQRKKSSLTNLKLAKILEFKKWDSVDYLSGDKRFKPMTRFCETQGLPLAKIVKNALTNKSNDKVANELSNQYKGYIRSGGLPFRTYASLKRNGISLVDTAQYIDACYVKIENSND